MSNTPDLSSLKTGCAILSGIAPSSLSAARQSAEIFFARSQEYKMQYICTDQKEMGYRQLANKEMFLIRDTQLPKELAACTELAREFHCLSLNCLNIISAQLNLDPAILLRLVDQQAFPTGAISSSVLRLINYHAATSDIAASDIHEDLGLLTFVCHTGVPALEIYDFAHDTGWLDIEAMQGTKDAIVMAGESLSLISNGYFIPASHRVRNTGLSRLSINYHLRLSNDATLDSEQLTSAITGQFNKPFHMTGGEFLLREIKARSSVNQSY